MVGMRLDVPFKMCTFSGDEDKTTMFCCPGEQRRLVLVDYIEYFFFVALGGWSAGNPCYRAFSFGPKSKTDGPCDRHQDLFQGISSLIFHDCNLFAINITKYST